jgi:hypothetical protein
MAPMNWIVRITNQIRVLWKWCISFLKRDWELADYPVSIRTQEPDPDSDFSAPRFKLNRYVASIANWHLTGGGDSKNEALINLEAKFVAAKLKRKKMGKPLPRPGAQVPIEFAPQQRIDAHAQLADDFIRRVLDLESAWISDESSLWDFHSEETNSALIDKIRQVYGVEVSDIESAKLCEILERIADQKPA